MTVLLVLVNGLCSSALAQDEWASATFAGSKGNASYQGGFDPAPEWETSSAEEEPRMQPMMFGGVDLGVPIMTDVDRDLVRPGVNLHAQGGLDLQYVAFFIHGGYRWIPIDFERAAKNGKSEYSGGGREPIENPYFGIGLRGQIPNGSRLLPYVSGSFDFDFWHFQETDVQCAGYSYWWCTSSDVYHFTTGFSGRVGTGIELPSGLYVDLGVGASMSFPGDFFEENQVWIEPYVGITQRL